MSLGEDRVRFKFNPSGNKSVDHLKMATALLIDACDDYKRNGEQARCAAIAQTKYEEACMWAVKAATTE